MVQKLLSLKQRKLVVEGFVGENNTKKYFYKIVRIIFSNLGL